MPSYNNANDQQEERVSDNTHLTDRAWNPERPSALVVACSDGRLQVNLDDFLYDALGIVHYDRLYTPGGGGALAIATTQLLRSDIYRSECNFLLQAHQIDDIYLIFHGPSEDGPEESLCADYRKRMPSASAEEIRRQQQIDADQVRSIDWCRPVRVHAYRCEVRSDQRVQFVRL
jgi:hypothetical protein